MIELQAYLRRLQVSLRALMVRQERPLLSGAPEAHNGNQFAFLRTNLSCHHTVIALGNLSA
jgi:hypothetical protein